MRLKNWVVSSLRNTGFALGIACLLSIYYFYILGDTSGSFFERLGLTIMFAIPLCVVIFTISAYKVDIPLAIAFSATRREAFIGLQLSRFIPTVLSVALGSGMMVCGDFVESHQVVSILMPMTLGSTLLLHVLGAIIGIAISRFGKIGGIPALTVGVMTAGLVGLLMTAEVERIVIDMPAVALLIVGVIAYAVVLPFEWHALKTLQVKL